MDVVNFFRGPWNNRSLTGVSYIRFGSRNKATQLLEKNENGKIDINGVQYGIKEASIESQNIRKQILSDAQQF